NMAPARCVASSGALRRRLLVGRRGRAHGGSGGGIGVGGCGIGVGGCGAIGLGYGAGGIGVRGGGGAVGGGHGAGGLGVGRIGGIGGVLLRALSTGDDRKRGDSSAGNENLTKRFRSHGSCFPWIYVPAEARDVRRPLSSAIPATSASRLLPI